MPDTLSRGTFVRVLREYADKANDNFSQKVAVPEHVLRDAAAVIEDQRAHIDALTAAVEGKIEAASYHRNYRQACIDIRAILRGEQEDPAHPTPQQVYDMSELVE